MVNIVEELKIISLVLELIPIDAELKKNLNLHAIALNLKPRLNKIAHNMATSGLESDGRCECLQKGYEPGLCRKKPVCGQIEKPYHTEKCWENLTTNYGGHLCTCENIHNKMANDSKEKEPKGKPEGPKDQLLKRLDSNSYSTVIDRIARGEFKLKHKWVELSEFVNSNPEWVNDNFKFIIAQAILFHKKGDLINYNYDIKNNKFIFDYAPGITKLMMPVVGFEE